LGPARSAVEAVGGQVVAASWAADVARPRVEIAEGSNSTDAAVGGSAAADAMATALARGTLKAAAPAVGRVVRSVCAWNASARSWATDADVAVLRNAIGEQILVLVAGRADTSSKDADFAGAAGCKAVVAGPWCQADGLPAERQGADPRGTDDAAEAAVVGVLADVHASSIAAVAWAAELECLERRNGAGTAEFGGNGCVGPGSKGAFTPADPRRASGREAVVQGRPAAVR
jgi:hypothetical protein